MNNILLISQARLGSTRLPGKVLKKIEGQSLLEIHLTRLKECKMVSEIILATTNNDEDIQIYNLVSSLGFFCFRGSENDVLDRYYQIAKLKKADWVVRVTADCPLIDPVLIDDVVGFVINSGKDYGSNVLVENFPDGQDVEVIKFEALEKSWINSTLNSDREHVTTYIRRNCDYNNGDLFSVINYDCDSNFANIRMTVDEILDFVLIDRLVVDLGIHKTWQEYTSYMIRNNLTTINSNIIRNEGTKISQNKDLSTKNVNSK